jgi:hypothetical protein
MAYPIAEVLSPKKPIHAATTLPASLAAIDVWASYEASPCEVNGPVALPPVPVPELLALVASAPVVLPPLVVSLPPVPLALVLVVPLEVGESDPQPATPAAIPAAATPENPAQRIQLVIAKLLGKAVTLRRNQPRRRARFARPGRERRTLRLFDHRSVDTCPASA